MAQDILELVVSEEGEDSKISPDVTIPNNDETNTKSEATTNDDAEKVKDDDNASLDISKEGGSEKSEIIDIMSMLPTDDNGKSAPSSEKVDYKALYELKVKAGEWNEVEDYETLDWDDEKTYNAIKEVHATPENKKENLVNNSEAEEYINNQKTLIDSLNGDDFKSKEGYINLIEHQYIKEKGLTKEEYGKIIEDMSDDEIEAKGEEIRKEYISGAKAAIKLKKEEDKKAAEAMEKQLEERTAKYREKALEHKEELGVTEDYIDSVIKMFNEGTIHDKISEFVSKSTANPIKLVKFLESETIDKKQKNKIKLADLQKKLNNK